MTTFSRPFFAALLALGFGAPAAPFTFAAPAVSVEAADDIVFLCPPCGMPCDAIVHTQGGVCEACGMRLVAGFREMAGRSVRGHFQNTRGKNVAILLFPGVEIIDFGPQFEIFGQAGMRVFTVAATDSALRMAFGLQVVPDYTFENAPDAEILVLPGGHVDSEDEHILDWIRRAHDRSAVTLSVCNGAFFLAAAGLLDGIEATTFAGSIGALQEAAPASRVVNDRRFVDNGKIVTAAGLAAGIDAALHVLGRYEGRGRAQEVATFLEYDWDAAGRFVRAQLADRHVRPIDDALAPFLVTTTRYEGDRSRWTLEAVVTDELVSIEDIVRLVEHQWSSGARWNKTGTREGRSEWTGLDSAGAGWTGSIGAVPQGGDFTMTVEVRAAE